MSFIELIKEIASETGLPRSEVRKVLLSLGDQVVKTVRAGETVKLVGFGVFYRVTLSKTGLMSEESDKVRFKQSRRLRGQVRRSGRAKES